MISIEVRGASGVAGSVLDRVIADTGADTSVLPWADCQQLQLDPTQGVPGLMWGVAGGSATTLGFAAWVNWMGKSIRVNSTRISSEAIALLGRDVLNSLDILFRGPSGEVVVNP